MYGWKIGIAGRIKDKYDLDFQTALSVVDAVIREVAEYHQLPGLLEGKRLNPLDIGKEKV